MIAGMEPNKKINPIFTELFLRGRKINISLAFISQFYFKMPKTIRINTTHYFTMKVPNKRELQKRIKIKIKQNKPQYDSDRQTAKVFLLYYQEMLENMNFWLAKILPEKNLLEKEATMNKLWYYSQDKELKTQTDIPNKQYQKLDETFQFDKIIKKEKPALENYNKVDLIYNSHN